MKLGHPVERDYRVPQHEMKLEQEAVDLKRVSLVFVVVIFLFSVATDTRYDTSFAAR